MPFSAEIETGVGRDLAHAILASDQDRRAEALGDEGMGGADDLLLLALGEHDPFGEAPHALDDPLQRAGDRVAPRRKLRLVGGHVDDRLAGDARRPSPPWRPAIGMTVIRRGSNGTGMM